MVRVKSTSHYIVIFSIILLIGYFLVGLIQFLTGLNVPGSGLFLPMVAAASTTAFFLQSESRYPDKAEGRKLIRLSFIVNVVLNLLLIGLVALGGVFGEFGDVFAGASPAMLAVIFLGVFIIYTAIQYLFIYLGYTKFRSKKVPQGQSEDKPLFEQAGVDANAAEDVSPNWTEETPQVTPQKAARGDWQPPNDGFAVRDERAPILKYSVGVLALLLVGGGAIWLASKVVVADEIPTIERADNTKDKPAKDETPPPKSADDLAWVKALEIDTVEGYRAYIAEFPNGRHVEDAQRLINEFDEEAWKLAEERDTIEGYEDYLESWPEGLHATEARDRIAELKAEEEARRKQAEEAARREAAAWRTAAETNTIPSYETYLASFPTGKNAPEAQTRIERLRAEAARQQASAADEAAWNAARATDTADAYQQYLTSFPQGAHVPEAIAKLEELRPGPGKTFKDCAVCPTMVSLPAGTAELGAQNSDGKAKPNEKPARPVTFTDLFAIGVTEVTFAQYGACVGAGGCKSLPGDNGWGQGSRPVINVSWSDAVAYAQWLSNICLLYTSPSPRDQRGSRMPSSA